MYISICKLTFENVYLPPNAPDFARARSGIHISRKSVVKFFCIVNSGIGRLLRMSTDIVKSATIPYAPDFACKFLES